jgi:hypothetical protein
MPAFARSAGAEILLGLLCFSLLLGCSTSESSPDGGEGVGRSDAPPTVIDLCDAFTTVGARCPLESPVRCFPECEAGGCYCRPGEGGVVWACVTDLSCVPDCGPLDDGCAGSE